MMTKYCAPQAEENDWTKVVVWLIPKKEGTEKVEELRPITCLSHGYKLLLKVLLNRMKDNFAPRDWNYGCSGGPGAEELAFIVAEGLRRNREWKFGFFVLN